MPRNGTVKNSGGNGSTKLSAEGVGAGGELELGNLERNRDFELETKDVHAFSKVLIENR